jgi:AcrR family transcriptional regulator
MGRPSLARERRAQILDAFESLVVEHGLEGTSLDATARAAGMKRQLVLHYFGSRTALVEAAVARVTERYAARIARTLGRFGDAERLERFVDWIFLGDFCDERTDALLGELAARGHRSPESRHAVGEAYRALEAVLVEELRKAAPAASLRRAREVAFVVLCLCFGSGDLLALDFPAARRRTARDAAITAIRALQREP